MNDIVNMKRYLDPEARCIPGCSRATSFRRYLRRFWFFFKVRMKQKPKTPFRTHGHFSLPPTTTNSQGFLDAILRKRVVEESFPLISKTFLGETGGGPHSPLRLKEGKWSYNSELGGPEGASSSRPYDPWLQCQHPSPLPDSCWCSVLVAKVGCSRIPVIGFALDIWSHVELKNKQKN